MNKEAVSLKTQRLWSGAVTSVKMWSWELAQCPFLAFLFEWCCVKASLESAAPRLQQMWRQYWRQMHLKLCLQAISEPIKQRRKVISNKGNRNRSPPLSVHLQQNSPNQRDLLSFGQAWREHEEVELSSHLLILLIWLPISFFFKD